MPSRHMGRVICCMGEEMRKLAIVATALAFTSTAYAADMPLKALSAPIASPSWTGLYIGINGGGVWGHTNIDIGLMNDPFVVLFSQQTRALGSHSISNSGGLAGGQIGYLLQTGQLIAGLEASFDWFNAKGNFSSTQQTTCCAPGTITNWTQTVSTDWLALFTARIGWDMGSWYPYVTAGGAVSKLNYTGSTFETTGSLTSTAASNSQVKVGIAGGGGLEWRWDSHWSLRGEYLFIGFDPITVLSPVLTAGVPIANSFYVHKATFYEHVARAALSYKF